MLPRIGSSKLISSWILITIAVSIVAVVDGGWLASWLALAPAHIWRGEVWRLVTWVLVEPGALSLVITCFIIYRFGGELATRWGDRRLRRFMIEVVLAASVGTALLALLTGGTHFHRLAGWLVDDVLVIAWARQFPQAPLQLYGLVTLSGQRLINVTLATAGAMALYYGPVHMAPELIGCAIAAWYPRGWLER